MSEGMRNLCLKPLYVATKTLSQNQYGPVNPLPNTEKWRKEVNNCK